MADESPWLRDREANYISLEQARYLARSILLQFSDLYLRLYKQDLVWITPRCNMDELQHNSSWVRIRDAELAPQAHAFDILITGHKADDNIDIPRVPRTRLTPLEASKVNWPDVAEMKRSNAQFHSKQTHDVAPGDKGTSVERILDEETIPLHQHGSDYTSSRSFDANPPPEGDVQHSPDIEKTIPPSLQGSWRTEDLLKKYGLDDRRVGGVDASTMSLQISALVCAAECCNACRHIGELQCG